MKTPQRLLPLIAESLIDEVVGQLQSGKEAEVYLVLSGENYLCAKIYKDAINRTFKQKTQYTEGRKVRNSRQARAMESNSKYGKQEREAEWQNTEVEALRVLGAAGVRVPKTYAYLDGVLLLELIAGEDGNPAPRLNDVKLTAERARELHKVLIGEVVLMLLAGIVHGDLSEFNVLLSSKGVVIIDLPQAVQATANNAFGIFERDVNQLAAYFGRFAPEILATNYASEIWNLYVNGKLLPTTSLTGKFEARGKRADVKSILQELEEVELDELERRGLMKRERN